MKIIHSGMVFAIVAVGTNCVKQTKPKTQTIVVINGAEIPRPAEGGKVIVAGPSPSPDEIQGSTFEVPGSHIVVPVLNFSGVNYFPVDGLLTPGSFENIQTAAVMASLDASQKRDVMAHELNATLKVMAEQGNVIPGQTDPEIGYFSAYIPVDQWANGMAKLAGSLPQHVVMNLRGYSGSIVKGMKVADHKSPTHVDGDSRSDTTSFSGLERMGVPEFLRMAQEDLGIVPDGSSVKVGVTDTGVTYSHPSFKDAQGKSRIQYLNEFTGEGRLYFDPQSKFELTIPNNAEQKDQLLVTADVIISPIHALTPPKAGVYSHLKQAPMLVNDDLRQILTSPGSGARLAVFSELAFAEKNDPANGIDLNNNGRVDDLLYALWLPATGTEPAKIYFSMVAKSLDFRFSKPLRDFNQTKDTMTVYAEEWGLVFGEETLHGDSKLESKVWTASIVGFDPGDHGTHVSGIIGGRKTIANDTDNTLARGAVPEVQLMVNRVCANNSGCYATEAIIDLAKRGAQIINMSLGGVPLTNDGYDVQSIIIDRLTSVYNVLFVISAGNDGPIMQSVGAPAVSRLALAVGATGTKSMISRQYQYESSGKPDVAQDNGQDTDFMLGFSSRGPSAAGGFKPTITAPGTELSAQPFNNNVGLDIMQGTSMAAPSATGAIALLLDAIHKYNAKAQPGHQMPEDALTLGRIIQSSARPFDVKTFNTESGEVREGQYTWIDQGNGMIDLAGAWKMLKHGAESPIASTVNSKNDAGVEQPVNLDYEIRTRFVNRHNIDYTGKNRIDDSQIKDLDPALESDSADQKYGRGVWVNLAENRSNYSVRIARRLPFSAAKRADAGALFQQLASTAEKFKLVTVIHGSDVPWLKAGTLISQDCAETSVTPYLTLIGPGSVRSSILQVCVDRSKLASLAPGDHGALVMGYRVDEQGRMEAHASFTVPVYLTVPHFMVGKVLSSTTQSGDKQVQAYTLNGTVPAFGIRRNYIEIPSGVTLVRIKLELPQANVENGVRHNCGGAYLSISKGSQVETLDAPSAITCDPASETINKAPVTIIEQENPSPGIWDLHVGGISAFRASVYQLTVDFVQTKASKDQISGGLEQLNGDLTFSMIRSFDAKPDPEKSGLFLTALSGTAEFSVDDKATVQLPSYEKKSLHQFPAEVKRVTVSTALADHSLDLDLNILQCDDETSQGSCQSVADSGGPDGNESASFTPKAGKFYRFDVVGFDTKGAPAKFSYTLTETYDEEKGAVSIDNANGNDFHVDYQFSKDGSKILKDQRFLAGSYQATGSLKIRTAAGSAIISIPVMITVPVTQIGPDTTLGQNVAP